MPAVTNKDEIRRILQVDRRWCVYALGDLTDRMFVKCQWFTPDLTLVLHDYGTSILFAMGTGSIREALDHVSWPVHLQVRPDALAEVAKFARISDVKQMVRMAYDGAANRTRPTADTEVRRLGLTDIEALKRLYADGEATGEAPDFFYDSMVPNGVFFGVYEGPELVAAAGTHLFAPEEDAAAIGNVYTRRDRRGRGLGKAVTSAVLARLRHVKTVGLNVRHDNAPAIRVYESLGFVTHCDFREAVAHPRA
ncbi:MAG TPA: GNAT family N-acetyltransferase [Vicinamibacterales bacterium]|nr:GNAT family N-acetyltransferase [Vicinamibacterales bacterium]